LGFHHDGSIHVPLEANSFEFHSSSSIESSG
jgi:hypothetical protein